jgi:hypothetical protein
MKETPQSHSVPENPLEIKGRTKKQAIDIAMELFEKRDLFPWPDIYQESYEKFKFTDEVLYPGLTAPIDEITARCRLEGIKIVLGKNPGSGNIFFLPAGSNDIEQWGLPIRHLMSDHVMDARLKKLIVRAQEFAEQVRIEQLYIK